MGSRLNLQMILEEILGSDKVFFQPPPTIQLTYPCIIYELNSGDTQFADNRPYAYKKRYTVQVIDRNPDSEIPDKIAMLPMCVFDRHYAVNNLNHYSFYLYY